MSRFAVLAVFIGLLLSAGFPQTIKEMKFENVKLSTVVKALAKVVGKSVIIDPDVEKILDKEANIFIQRPVSVDEAFNIILREYGLIAVPVNREIYKVTKAGELEVGIKDLDDKDIDKVIGLLKRRVSPSAEIVIDKTLKVIYIRDEERRIKKLEKPLKEFIERIVAEKRLGVEEKPEAVITRVFYLKTISLSEAKEILAPHITKETVITEAPTFNALVITDKVDRLKKYEELLKEFLVTAPAARKPVTEIFYLKYISPEEFIKMIEPIRSEAGLVLTGGAVRTERTPEDRRTAQRVTPVLKEFNAVMITDYPEVIEKIKEQFSEYISDIPPQVKIEARILEVRKEALRELGINWSALLSNVRSPEFWSAGAGANLGVGATGSLNPGLSRIRGGILTFTYSRGILNALNLRLSALERVGKIKNLAKPTVITINGQEAVIKQGQDIPYQTAVIAGGTSVPSIQFREAVLELRVLPIISPDGRILLDIKLKQDTPGVLTPQGPAINRKEVTTKVIVNNGDTVVIGGIIDTQKNVTVEGIPGVARIPLLKWLFGQERIDIRDVELLIFITPTILYE
ncbi:MAG: pilus assembly protein [Aquificota bacterium]|nr:pilus assembly protein [Aquificota bacterium]